MTKYGQTYILELRDDIHHVVMHQVITCDPTMCGDVISHYIMSLCYYLGRQCMSCNVCIETFYHVQLAITPPTLVKTKSNVSSDSV